jgi:hypothetical protein
MARLLLIILLLVAAAAWRGQIFGIKTDGTSHDIPKAELTANDGKKFFQEASIISKIDNQHFQIFNANREPLGQAIWYKGEHGYGGRIPLFVFFDTKNIVRGVLPGKHYETSDYLNDILESGFLSQWNGISKDSVLSHQVDMISGATLSSQAIISGVKSVVSGSEVIADYSLFTLKNLLSFALLILLTIAYLIPKWLMKYRTILQVLSLVVFGFWLHHLLSLNQIMAWVAAGFNFKAQYFIVVLFILAIILPVVFGKSFYCSGVCPYGAAQELCGKTTSKKIKLPPVLTKILRYSREAIFFAIMIILWAGFIIDLSLVEPFAAFFITKAGYFTMALAGFFLIVSLFVPKAWCKYFCPTGYLLEWIRNE